MVSYVKGESPLPEAPVVYRCSECAARVPHMEALQAPDPFNDGEIMFGCPRCRSANTLEVACVADGCHAATVMGVPGRGGYRMAGLRVECEVVSFQSIGDRHERQQIVAVVSRVIE